MFWILLVFILIIIGCITPNDVKQYFYNKLQNDSNVKTNDTKPQPDNIQELQVSKPNENK